MLRLDTTELVQVECCFSPTKNIRPSRLSHSCWTLRSSNSLLLYVHRDRTDYQGRGAQDGHLDFHTARELWKQYYMEQKQNNNNNNKTKTKNFTIDYSLKTRIETRCKQSLDFETRHTESFTHATSCTQVGIPECEIINWSDTNYRKRLLATSISSTLNKRRGEGGSEELRQSLQSGLYSDELAVWHPVAKQRSAHWSKNRSNEGGHHRWFPVVSQRTVSRPRRNGTYGWLPCGLQSKST